MSKIRITKQFSFETGHALYGHDGKCKNIHGHSHRRKKHFHHRTVFVTTFFVTGGDKSSSCLDMFSYFWSTKKIIIFGVPSILEKL